MSKSKKISIVIPMYCEEKVAQKCYDTLLSVLKNLAPAYDYEILFVNDGSQDKTGDILKQIAKKDKKVRVLSFSRNFGHQMAITAGMDYASGDALVTIDADLQDPPELIPKLIEKWEEGYEIVYAKRQKRKGETVFKKTTATLFYRFINTLSDTPIPMDIGDFRLLDQKVCQQLQRLTERQRFIRGLVSWVGFKQTEVLYTRKERFAGATKYPLKKMIRFALDGIFSFSDKPLKWASYLGLGSILIGLALVVYVLISKWVFPDTTVSGWSSLLIVIIFFGGIQLLTLGIIGEYLSRMYDELKNRPLYILNPDETINPN